MIIKKVIKSCTIITISLFLVGIIQIGFSHPANDVSPIPQSTMKTSFNPFKEGWTYRKQITINHTLVAGALEDFPVLISITDGDLRDKAQDDGDDVLFMDGIGIATQLYHELELFDGVTGQMVAWVNIPVLSSTDDTSIWMYYGNSNSSNQENPTEVWDSDYEAVYHMNDETTSTILDSTANNHDLTKHAVNSPTESTNGKVGNCQNFDGSDDWMTAPTWFMGSELSVSVWVTAEHDISDDFYRIYQIEDASSAQNYEAHGFSVSNTWQPSFSCDLTTCSNQYIRYSDCVISQNSWYHLGVTRASASRANLFLNGMKATGTITERSTNWAGAIGYNNGGNFKIGVFKESSTIPYGASWWGKIDEFRLSSCSRNVSWISTEYNSMMYSSIFTSIGSEETIPDLDCNGTLSWTGIQPGSTITGTFHVGNIGQPGSLLNWQITGYPAWGTWTFSPASGTGLAAGSWTAVTATCVAPSDKNTLYSGTVNITNSDDSTDVCQISVSLKTPFSFDITLPSFFQRLFECFPNTFPLLQYLFGINE